MQCILALDNETPPPIFRLGLGSLRGYLGSRLGWPRGLCVLGSGESVWGLFSGVGPCVGLGKGALSLRLSLLFHFVSKGTKFI